MAINKMINAYLSDAVVTQDGHANRTWFDLAVARSKAAIAFAQGEKDRELAALVQDVREGFSDHTDYGEYV